MHISNIADIQYERKKSCETKFIELPSVKVWTKAKKRGKIKILSRFGLHLQKACEKT